MGEEVEGGLTMDREALAAWIGRRETIEDTIAAGPAARLAATLDGIAAHPWLAGRAGAPFPASGDPLPHAWHWIYFLPAPPRRALGRDGHPTVGGFLPPVALPRRMWAGGRLRFAGDLRIGDAARRVSTVRDVQFKEGRSGALCFVTVTHEVFAGETLLIEETQDIVYREAPRGESAPASASAAAGAPAAAPAVAGGPAAPAAASTPAPVDAQFVRDVTPDEVLLFRYSALTFNGHRIHYDRRFCAQQEGYPGLVVHGPLLSTLLLDLAAAEAARAGRRIAEFSFRAVAPLFDTAPFRLAGARDGDTLRLWASGPSGALASTAQVTFAPA